MPPSSASPERADGAAAAPRGHLDTVDHGRVTGWAWDGGAGRTVVIVTAGERVVARALADRHRGDLADAGIGDGHHAFELILDTPLDPAADHVVGVRREHDGAHLDGSPRILRGSAVLSDADRAGASVLLASACDDAELDARLLFLSEQAEALRGRRAARDQAPQHRTGAETAAARQPRALVIDDAPPRAAHDAGSDAVLSHMLSLQRLGFAVSFAAADMALGPGLEALGVSGLARPRFGSVEEVLRRETGRFDLVYLHRVSNASRYTALVLRPGLRVMSAEGST